MGSGKTSWSIQYINENPDENILYITPFLEEVDRIITHTKRKFYQPLNRGKGKLDSINSLLSCQYDIASTHELFKRLDRDGKECIANGNYTLILDEVLNVIEPYENVKSDDMKILRESHCISIDDEGFIIWDEDKTDYDMKYNEFKLLAESRSLVCVNQRILLWRYPPEIFKLFNKVYVLTYLFDATIMKNYFELYDIDYKKKSIKESSGKYYITNFYSPDTTIYKDKINVYEGKMNRNISQKVNAFSVSWYRSAVNEKDIKQVKNNVYNYFSNRLKAKSGTIMWTTFKDYKSELRGRGYTKRFVSCNCRSTNKYEDTYNLAYCINVYLHPGITRFFSSKGITINEDLYSLSEMIQWIWRSRVRNNKSINIYIPSQRMRNLLYDWMDMTLDY